MGESLKQYLFHTKTTAIWWWSLQKWEWLLRNENVTRRKCSDRITIPWVCWRSAWCLKKYYCQRKTVSCLITSVSMLVHVAYSAKVQLAVPESCKRREFDIINVLRLTKRGAETFSEPGICCCIKVWHTNLFHTSNNLCNNRMDTLTTNTKNSNSHEAKQDRCIYILYIFSWNLVNAISKLPLMHHIKPPHSLPSEASWSEIIYVWKSGGICILKGQAWAWMSLDFNQLHVAAKKTRLCNLYIKST